MCYFTSINMVILLNMNLIINDNNFSIHNIVLKKSKRSTKVIYRFKSIDIIGATFTLNSFNYKYNDNYLDIKLEDKTQINNFIDIDKYFMDHILDYDPFINKGIIKIKGNFKNHNIKNNINISLNSLKKINGKNKVQIFII